MDSKKKIVVVDRSHLAANFYSIIFSSLGQAFIMLKDLPSFFDRIDNRERFDLAIVSSNLLKRGDLHKNFAPFRDEIRINQLNKIFLCKDDSSDESLIIALNELNNAKIIRRPFHPAEFKKTIIGSLKEDHVRTY